MPYMLDATGAMLLSGSAMLWFGLAAGVASLGVSCLVLNWRFFGS